MRHKKIIFLWVVISVKLNFMKTISERLNSVNVAIISGHKWNENKFHIKYSSGRTTTDSVAVGWEKGCAKWSVDDDKKKMTAVKKIKF